MYTESQVKRWTCSQVSDWLGQNGLSEQIDFFARHEIDGEVLLTMTETDLRSPPLNMTIFGQIRKIKKALEKLNETLECEPGTFTNEFSQMMMATVANADQNQEIPTVKLSHKEIKKSELASKSAEVANFFPAYCWEIDQNQETLLKLYLGASTLKNARFLAEVSHLVSPVEFYLQPLFLMDEIDRLQSNMDSHYSKTVFKDIPFADFIYEGMPCVASYAEDGSYYRAKVEHIGGEDCKLTFIDWGNGQFEPMCALKPLLPKFAHIPSLTLRCRIDGVLERTLIQNRIEQFRNEINETLQKRVYCLIKKVKDHIFYVDLLHPKTKQNIGAKFYPTEPIVPGFKFLLPEAAPNDVQQSEECSETDTNEIKNTPKTRIRNTTVNDDVEEIASLSSSISEPEPENSDEPKVQLQPARNLVSGGSATSPDVESAKFETVIKIQSEIIRVVDEDNIEEPNEPGFTRQVPLKKPNVATKMVAQENKQLIKDVSQSLHTSGDEPVTPNPTPIGPWMQRTQQWPSNNGFSGTSVDATKIKQILAEKEEKMRQGRYANPLEAFLDGAPMDSGDSDGENYDQNRRKKSGDGKKTRH